MTGPLAEAETTTAVANTEKIKFLKETMVNRFYQERVQQRLWVVEDVVEKRKMRRGGF